MTQLKMPEPAVIYGGKRHRRIDTKECWGYLKSSDLDKNTPLYTAEALRDVLEQAVQICEAKRIEELSFITEDLSETAQRILRICAGVAEMNMLKIQMLKEQIE